MQVSRWGNSLAIRLPAAVVEVLGLKEGDDIEVNVVSVGEIGIRPASDGDLEALQRLRALRGRMPADFKFDRLEANARGE